MRDGVMKSEWRWLTGLILLAGGIGLAFSPHRAPRLVGVGLLLTGGTVRRAWRAAGGTALRPAIVWAGLALGLGLVSQAVALREPLESGRPWCGHCVYLATLAALASLISVLNARTPGGGAWALLMALLVLVFLIPLLEGLGLARGVGLLRLRLDLPWTIFFGLLVLAGVTNYLPTRYGPAAVVLAAGFGLEYFGLTRRVTSPASLSTVWSAVPWTFALAVALADLRSTAGPEPSGPEEAVWFWFRDHWGVVWALRVMERFNRSAEAQRWPFRLSWQGLVAAGTETDAAEHARARAAAGATLQTLLRRFATPGRLARAAGEGSPPLASDRALGDDA
jgi:hypothetical protein